VPRYVSGISRSRVGLAILAALSTVTVAVTPLAAAASAPAGAAAPAGPAAGRARSLTLINGQQVLLRPGPDGRLSVTALAPSDGTTSELDRFNFCGQVAEIPSAALPFLGRGLDPSLFLVRSLLRAEHGGRLPVRLAWAGPRRPALPGVTITRAGPGTASGYLTPAGGRAFGTALRKQAAADHGRASYGTDGLFAHGLSVTLAGARALPRTPGRAVPAPPGHPRFAQHTLTVRATNVAGRPDDGDTVLVFNADNCLRFGDPFETMNVFRHGVAKFSVPAGHYWAFGDFIDPGSFPAVDRIAILPQFSVHGNTTVSLAARAATSEVGFTTPRPAVAQIVNFGLLRTGADHSVSGAEWSAFNARILVSPVSVPPAVGGLLSFSSAQLTSPKSAAGPPYVYNVDHSSPPGLVGPQHVDVSPQSLATVQERFFQDVPSHGEWLIFGGTATEFTVGLSAEFLPIRLPGLATEYVSGGPDRFWSTQYVEFTSQTSLFGGGGQTGAFESPAAGQQTTEDWNRYPLHSGPMQVLTTALPFPQAIPSASRTGNQIALDPVPFSDSQPGHIGSGLFPGARTHPSGRYTLSADGRRIAAGIPIEGPVFARVPARPSLLRYTLTARRGSPAYALSPASRTVWTWRSRPDPAARVPGAWVCANLRGQDQVFTRRCAVQPMMTLEYAVDGLGLNGTAPAGPQAINITAGHLQLSPAAAVTGAAVAVSFDGGAHWTPATVTRQGAGQFRAAFTAPPGALVTLRASASDALGGSVTESITRAYRTAPATATLAAHHLAAHPGHPAGSPARPAGPATMATPPCARPRPGRVQCDLRYQVPATASRAAGPRSRPHGWGARALEAAYRLPAGRHSHQTVAVSIAFRIPHLARDLAIYRKHYGLPPCTPASGCLRVVNAAGRRSPLPQSGKNTGWDLEGTLDVSMVSAACPHCRILVVEGDDDSIDSLAQTEATAARLGAQVISNSYGTRENGFALADRRSYIQPGHTVVVSSGDFGFSAANFPADLQGVISVGGTQLSRSASARGFAERVWDDPQSGAAASGCSAYIGKPRWQHDAHCPGRTVADVAAVAANVPVFEPTYGGWVTVAGTSISAPFIAGVYGLAGNAARIGPRHLYRHAGDLFDVTAGSNTLFITPAQACGRDYLCTAKPGYDAPTGLGTPNGLGAF
jgi:subtilase family protein